MVFQYVFSNFDVGKVKSMKRQKREFVSGDIENLPGFLRIEVIDGEIYTDAWTVLEIDEDVFKIPATEDRHIKYKLSIVEIEE